MPLYEYQCQKCKERVEIIQRMSDPAPTQCAKCSGEMKKLISSPAFQFKGSGFYKTDYASGSGSKSSGESSSDSKSDSKSESKSDSKSESKTESKSETKSESSKSESTSAKSD